ncbi:MAG TPA: DUF1439 domain-containing protein [Telluria sp.]|nr:DUF1439 domain-containing protein [Telluria sp.]
MNRRQYLLALLAGGLLAGCAGLLGPRQASIPVERMQASLDRRFPLNQRLLEVFDIVLTHPRITLLPDQGRVALDMEAALAPRFGGADWRGALSLSGRLELDQGRNAVLLRDGRIDQFYLDRLDPSTQKQMTRLANVLLDRVVRDLVVYQFRPEDLRLAGVQFVPTRLVTTAGAVEVTLEPVR